MAAVGQKRVAVGAGWVVVGAVWTAVAEVSSWAGVVAAGRASSPLGAAHRPSQQLPCYPPEPRLVAPEALVQVCAVVTLQICVVEPAWGVVMASAGVLQVQVAEAV